MKNFLKKKKIWFSGLLTVLLLSGLIIGAILLSETKPLTNSTAEIKLQNNTLLVSFEIDSSERPGFEAFSQAMGSDDQWLEGISITLDKEAADQVRPYLPQTVRIEANARGLSFANSSGTKLLSGGLQSAQPNQNLEWASGSGRLAIVRENGGLRLLAEDPGTVLQQASQSGAISLAPGLFDQFWPVANKFARIEIQLGTNFLRGVFNLE